MKTLLTRRDFLKYCGIGTVGTAAALALAGCSDSSSSDLESSASSDSGLTSDADSDSESGNTNLVSPDMTNQSSSEDAHTTAHQIHDLVMYVTSETDTLNAFYTENGSSSFLRNLYDCWLCKDKFGNVAPLLADDYYANSDSTSWTFHLRSGATWVDNQLNYKADVTVYDFLTSAEYILNYWKNAGNNASMLQGSVAGALDYYEYTMTLDESEAMALTYNDDFADMVSIVADASAGTVTYNCNQPTPYFWSIACHKSTAPLAQGLVDEVGVENYNGVNWDQLWSCGGYIMTECILNNTKTFVKNTTYWNYDNVSLFDSITLLCIESIDTGYQLFQNGEIDQIELGQSTLVNILNDDTHKFHDYVTKQYGTTVTYQMHFNYDKKNDDDTPDTNWNTAIANENFRKAIYWGLDLEGYFSMTDPVSPFSVAGYTFSQSNFVQIDGIDYQDYVISRIGLEKSNDYYSRYNPDLAAEYLSKAVEELSEAGVSFPIAINHYIASGNQTSLDQATVLKAAFDNLFGDLATFEIRTYISSLQKEVINYGYQCYALSAWTADYDDPSNTIEQISLTTTNNAYLKYNNVLNLTSGSAHECFTELTNLCRAADEIVDDLNERYRAYAEAEVYSIEHCLTIPINTNAVWQLTRVNDYSKSRRGQDYQNWETNSEMYSSADYNTFAAEREQGIC